MSAPVEFSVWAPLPERVRVQVDGTLHDMSRDDEGWWRAEVEAAPEADYGFLLDDNDTARPDPRSRRQPEGVHGLSRRFDPDAYEWGDDSWTGRPLAAAPRSPERDRGAGARPARPPRARPPPARGAPGRPGGGGRTGGGRRPGAGPRPAAPPPGPPSATSPDQAPAYIRRGV